MKFERKVENNNFTKLTRNGISLIVLVITIIVIIILATAIILTINNNNPIAEANFARYQSDVANMQAIFTNTVAKIMAKNRGVISIKPGQIDVTTGEVLYVVTDAENSNNSSGKIIFDKGNNTDTVYYTGKKLPIYSAGETKWYIDENANIALDIEGNEYGIGEISKINAKTIANNASLYYGAYVDYKTGNTSIDDQVSWKIFHSDTNNIYLIASDYVPYNLLPTKTVIESDGTKTVYSLKKCANEYRANFEDIIPAYSGSENITDTKIQNLNSVYFQYLTTNNLVSENINMKAVAYMLDTDIWSSFKNQNADYVIGGPTAEMFLDSYNNRYNTPEYLLKVLGIEGYTASGDNGVNWSTGYSIWLPTDDTLYTVIDSMDISYSMWLASPSGDSDGKTLRAMDVDGCFYRSVYNYPDGQAFRPIVCLNSNVELKQIPTGFEIME